ncbi:MAG: hypothetical protein QXE50_08160 [Nitrososphaerota archaeon]
MYKIIAVAREFISLSTETKNLPWIGSLLRFPISIAPFHAFAIASSIETPISEPILALSSPTTSQTQEEIFQAASTAYQSTITYRITAITMGYFSESPSGEIENITYGVPPGIPLLFTNAIPISTETCRTIVLSNPLLFFARFMNLEEWEKLLPAFSHYLHYLIKPSQEDLRKIAYAFLDAFFAQEQKANRGRTTITLRSFTQAFPSLPRNAYDPEKRPPPSLSTY